jgi:uncharacterized DUF497 family protein
VLDKLLGFDWDDANVGHIWRHSVVPNEVQEVVLGPKKVIAPAITVKRERRWRLYGKTSAGRYLTIVFTIRRKLFRTVTAFDMNLTDRRTYGPQIY